MGILIRRKNEEVKLVFKDNIDFITEDYMALINELTTLIQHHINLEQALKSKESSLLQVNNKLQKVIKEQQDIDIEIKGFLSFRDNLCSSLEQNFDNSVFLENNNMLSKLISKLKQLNFEMLQLTTQKKQYLKTINNIQHQLEILKEKIDALKILLKIEHRKINNKNTTANICLSILFEKITNVQLNQLLKKVMRNNFELEKQILSLLAKGSIRILNNNKESNLFKLINEMNVLLKINNMIYDFISDLLSRDNISFETIYLLQ